MPTEALGRLPDPRHTRAARAVLRGTKLVKEVEWHDGLLNRRCMAAQDKLGVLICQDNPLPANAFSLAPGSINTLIRGKSGAVYTGREMG